MLSKRLPYRIIISLYLKKNLNAPKHNQAVSYEEIFPRNVGVGGVKKFLGKFRQVHNLKISDRLLRSKSFFKKIFLVLYTAYFVVREEGMGWGGKTLMEE